MKERRTPTIERGRTARHRHKISQGQAYELPAHTTRIGRAIYRGGIYGDRPKRWKKKKGVMAHTRYNLFNAIFRDFPRCVSFSSRLLIPYNHTPSDLLSLLSHPPSFSFCYVGVWYAQSHMLAPSCDEGSSTQPRHIKRQKVGWRGLNELDQRICIWITSWRCLSLILLAEI